MGDLRIENISISFGGLAALTDVSLEICEGELLAIIGPNGAGKTTLYNCISGIYKPNKGDVRLGDESLVGMPPHKIAKRGIARTFQNIGLFQNVTVLDNLMLGRYMHMQSGVIRSGLFTKSVAREERKHRLRVEEIIEFLDLEHVRGKVVGSLPFGVQKRLELGRALAMEPKHLLLDEPTAGMNMDEKRAMVRFILDVKHLMNITIALIEHDMGVVMGIADRIAVLDFGKKIAEGLPGEIQRNKQVIEAYLGEEQSRASIRPSAPGISSEVPER